ncbi:MAG: ERAP1-like C-terminal domain-containing protein [Rhizomicrobium sp.]
MPRGSPPCPPENQFGLLNDSHALGYSGYAPLTDFLSLAQQTKSAMDPQVQAAVAARLQGIDFLYDGLPGQPAFRSFGRTLLEPLFAKVGWDAKPAESQNAALLRATLLDALSQFDDAAVIAEARTRFAAYLKDPVHIAPDTRRSMLKIVALHATPRPGTSCIVWQKRARPQWSRTSSTGRSARFATALWRPKPSR